MAVNFKTINKCRVCGSKTLKGVLSLGNHRIVGFSSKKAPRVPLDLVLCSKCELLQLKHTTKPELLWNENYGYRSGINSKMIRHLHSIAKEAEKFLKKGDVVLDIGCNDGTLLKGYSKKVYKVGIDPSENVTKYATLLDNTSILFDFFNKEVYFKSIKKKAKVITAISMFYDLDDPNQFVSDVKECLAPDGVFIIQQNYLMAMLKQNAFDNICHEHLEYYSLTSLNNLLKRHGLEVFKVEENDLNGGSFRTYICRSQQMKVTPSVGKMLKEEKPDYKEFEDQVGRIAKYINWFVKKEVKKGSTVYVYGASTRGGTLLQACELDGTIIKAAVERNPDKFGKIMESVGIPIISEAQAREDQPDYMIILPWFFADYFVKRESEYLKKGGKFIVPLPLPHIYDYSSIS